MKMPKNKKSLYQRLTEVSGDPQTITELSRCHPDDPSSESLIHNEAKGHNLDVFAGRFADKHSLPPVCTDQGECPMKPSSCDSIFVMNNGDIYLVEYKKTGVYKNGNYVVNDTHDYQIEILKKLYDTYIMLNVEQLLSYATARTKTRVLVVVDENQNDLHNHAQRIQSHLSNLGSEKRIANKLKGYLYLDIVLLGQSSFTGTYLPKIIRDSVLNSNNFQ